MKTNALEITLTWDANTEPDLSHYGVHRCSTPDGVFEQIAIVTVGQEFATLSLGEGTHYFKLTAVDEVGNVSAFGPVSELLTIDRTSPAAPGMVTITIGVAA